MSLSSFTPDYSCVISKTDLAQIMRELQGLIDSKYMTGVSDKADQENFSPLFMQFLNYSAKEAKALSVDQLQAIKDQLKKLPVMRMEVATPFTQGDLKYWHGVVYAITGGVILDIEVRDDLIGGARISYGGNYLDASISGRWKELWEEVVKNEEVAHV